MKIYSKPELDVIEIQYENAILSNSKEEEEVKGYYDGDGNFIPY